MLSNRSSGLLGMAADPGLVSMLASMKPKQRQDYVAQHSDDINVVIMGKIVSDIANKLQVAQDGNQNGETSTVLEQTIAAIDPETQVQQQQAPQQAPQQAMPQQAMPQQAMPQQAMPQAMPQPAMPQAMPQPAMPQPAMPQPAMPQQPLPPQAPQQQRQTRMAADGGYMDSRLPEEMGIGALPERSLSNMADGGIVGFAEKGLVKPKIDPVQNFATKNYSLAEQAGKALGVEPGIIIAQWGHETGWGKGVPGKYNLGNIKGKGTQAFDSLEKSNSQYKNYESPEAFVQDYVSQIKRNFPDAVGAGGDVNQFTKGLQKGRLGAYATDPDYAKKIASAVTKILPVGSAQGQTPAPPAAAPVTAANADAARDALVAQIPGNDNRYVAPQKTSKEKSDKSFSQFTGNEQVVGAGEAALGLGTGLVDYLGSAAKGLFTGITGGDTQKAGNESMGSATYDPRSEAGRVALENSQKFLTDTLKLPPFIARIGAGTPYPAARFVKPKEPVAPTSVPAATPTPAVRTVPTPAQVAAGNPSVTTAKPPVAQPPVVTPRLEGLQRINEAKKNNAAIRLAAEQEAAAKAGAPPPPNLVINPRVVPAKPKPVEVAGLPAIIEQTAAKEAAVKEAAAKEAAATAAKETVVKEAEVQAAPDVIPEGTGNLIEFPKASPRITYPNVVTSLAKNAGAAATATEGADNTGTAIDENSVLRGKSGIADIDIGPEQKRPPFDRTSGDDTTQFPSITPEIAQTAVTLAQAEIPKKEQGGFGYEDLLMFGLNLMAGQSPNALTNVGTAGIATLTARQARAKAEAEKSKSEAESDYYKARGEAYRDTVLTGPEKRALAQKKVDDEKDAKAEKARIQQNDLERKIEADKVNRQTKAEAVLDKDKEYQLALINALGAKSAFDRISNPTQQEKEKYLQSQNIPKEIKRQIYKSFGINPLGSNTSSAGWNIAPAP